MPYRVDTITLLKTVFRYLGIEIYTRKFCIVNEFSNSFPNIKYRVLYLIPNNTPLLCDLFIYVFSFRPNSVI